MSRTLLQVENEVTTNKAKIEEGYQNKVNKTKNETQIVLFIFCLTFSSLHSAIIYFNLFKRSI